MTVARLQDWHVARRTNCRRLADLVAQLEGLVRAAEGGEDLRYRLQVLEQRMEQLANDIQDSLTFVRERERPVLLGKWGGPMTHARMALRKEAG